MRKTWLWLCLLLLLLPAAALATPDTPYAVDTMLFYSQLTAEQQTIFDLTYKAAYNGEERVYLPEGTAYDDAELVMQLIYLECPELCALDNHYSINYYRDEWDRARYITLRYQRPASDQAIVVNKARELARQAGGDAFQREVFLHDALCGMVTYDLSAPNQHTAWGALVDRRSVCDGYALALSLMLRLSGVPCSAVQGASVDGQESHVWNLVKIDGSYTWLDATNNDQDNGVSYFFFNITDEWLRRSYIPDMMVPLPACDDRYVSWHYMNGCMVEGPVDAEIMITDSFFDMEMHGKRFNLRFCTEEEYLSMRYNVLDWVDRYNAMYERNLSGMFYTYSSDAQRCVIVEWEPD